MHGSHVFVELDFSLGFGVEFLEVLDESFGHGNQRLLGPGQKPVDAALVEKRGELSGSLSEFLSHGREAQHDVQIVPDSVQEVSVKLDRGRLGHIVDLAVLLSDVS